ncbi:MAG: hypothetical protein ABR985_18060 [Methanotrichaceae archaeon]|jgi:hypothetical protein
MTKIYKSLEALNNKRIIDIFIESPKEWLSRGEMVDLLRKFTGGSDTGSSLIELSRAGLLTRKARNKERIYRISTKSKAYRDIFYGYRSSAPKRFLESNYTTCMIEKRGFEKIYEIIKPELKDTEFRKIASTLLDPTFRASHQIIRK